MFSMFVLATVSIVASRRRGKKRDGKSTRPVVSRNEVVKILKKYYGIENSKVEDLDSYDDLNFRVGIKDEFYVLKIFSSRRGDASMVIMENKAMAHVESNSKNVAIPRVISPRLTHQNGVVTFYSKAEPETPYYVRVLLFHIFLPRAHTHIHANMLNRDIRYVFSHIFEVHFLVIGENPHPEIYLNVSDKPWVIWTMR